MGDIKLLDCTLRDGGYINDWEFGHDNLVSIFERITAANVEIIEVGFLDDRRIFDINRSIMPDTMSVEKIYGELDRNQAMVVGMIDYGTCDIKNIQPCRDSFLDGIRVIFKKHLRREAMAFCAQLKELGYKVFSQLVSITSYNDDELLDLIGLANEIQPYAVSMVDTYGLLHQDSLLHYFTILNENLHPGIGLGYHSHNNFQLAYANCIAMLANSVDRTVIVDATIYGMGKSAGNAPIELVAMHLNEHYGKQYQVSQILEAIDANIMNIYRMSPWGYNMFYYVAASNDCHPSYVSYLMDKRTLSVKSVNEILQKLQGEKKLLYNADYIEELYMEYQKRDVDDTADMERLTDIFRGKEVLVLGPGPNLKKETERVRHFCEEKERIILSINFIPEGIIPDYVFLSNSKRYVQLATVLSRPENPFQVIATSNVTKANGSFEYTLKYSELLDFKADIADNSIAMLLKVLVTTGAEKVWLAGFDGYEGNRKNYIRANMEYEFDSEKAKCHNQYMKKVLQKLREKIEICFLTDSLYEDTGR